MGDRETMVDSMGLLVIGRVLGVKLPFNQTIFGIPGNVHVVEGCDKTQKDGIRNPFYESKEDQPNRSKCTTTKHINP